MAPSFEISVQKILVTPNPSILAIKSKILIPPSSSQPLILIFSSSTSAPIKNLSVPNSSSHSSSKNGCFTARLPIVTMAAPALKILATSVILFTPPPKSITKPVAAAIFSSTLKLIIFPALAPSRSTMCRRLIPAASNCFATSTGLSLYTICLA